MEIFISNLSLALVVFLYLLALMVVAHLVEKYTGISGYATVLAIVILTTICLTIIGG